MKLFKVFTILLLLGSTCGSMKAYCKSEQYLLKCKLEGLPDGSLIVMRTQKGDTLQTAKYTNNIALFTGTLEPDGRFVFLWLDPLVYDKPLGPIFLKNKGKVTVNGVVGKRELIITGSLEQEKFDNIRQAEKSILQELNNNHAASNNFYQSIEIDPNTYKAIDPTNQKKIDSFLLVQERLIQKKDAELLRLTINPPYDLLTPYLMKQILGVKNYQIIQDTFKKIPSTIQESVYGRELKNELKYAATYTQIRQGGTIPDLKLADADGNIVSIVDAAKKNKFTLIDMWASWCAPCRAAFPDLKKAYTTYKDNGFEIVGISSDKNKTSWEKAIQDENLEWTQFIELNDQPFSKMCGIEGIPSYILLDQDGKILSFNSPMSYPKPFGTSLTPSSLLSTLENLYNSIK